MIRFHLLASSVVAGALALAACATTGVGSAPRSPEAERQLASYLDGRVAGPPQSCLPAYRSQDLVVIDENTVLFRDGSNRVWRNDLNGPCNGLGRGGTALLTKQMGSGMCRGEIAQVIDTAQGFTVGSCSFGDFVPYTGPGRR